jgi:glucose-1-phosphate thymidylyltransferase
MRGVLLAGGLGKRLDPLTRGVNKHLLPVGDVPMIVHPLSSLVEAGISEILVVSSSDGVSGLARALGSGASFGADLSYRVQEQPRGISDALGLARSFARGGPLCVVLGDNLFDASLKESLSAHEHSGGALVLLKRVPDPERYGVARLDGDRVVEILEKPSDPPSEWAVTGIYFYDARVFELLQELTPSARGELEITDLNNAYIAKGELYWRELPGRWIDAGTLTAYREANALFGRT